MKKKIMFLSVATLLIFALMSFMNPWNIPAKYKTMKNPYANQTDLAQTVGKQLWAKNCKSCHGNLGLGDGPKAAGLKTKIEKISEVQPNTDGEIYYKSIIGRDEMPNFEGKIPDEEGRWAIVNYIRTLK